MQNKIKNPKFFITSIFLCFLTFGVTNAFSQQKNSNPYIKKFNLFCKELKRSMIQYVPDTTYAGFGIYKEFEYIFFDRPEIQKNFLKDTSVYNDVAKFLIVQQFIAVLQQYVKNIPTSNLKVFDYVKHKNMTFDFEKDDKEEIEMLQNSLMLVYKDTKKQIDLMIITFNPQNNKILFLSGVGITQEDSKYVSSKLKNK
jgi:hypothetical protein